MARGINKVILIGNLGNDPEVRYMPNGNPVATLSVATAEGWKDKQTGERKERTEWHRVVYFNKLGEIAGEYLRKGSKIYVEGSLKTRKWQDQSGQDRYTTEIVGNELQMLDSKGGNDSGQFNQAPRQNTAPSMQQNSAPQQQRQQPASAAAPQFDDSFDDDIPF